MAAALLLTLSLDRTAQSGAPAASDAYVWQMRWTPGLARAIAGNDDLFQAWHVLAAEISAQDVTRIAGVEWSWTSAGGHAVVPVVRIEGRITPARVPGLLARIGAVRAALPDAARGRLEIDHDAATARLADYADFLRALRASLGPGTMLSVTVLPTWIASAPFGPVADAADLLVLQVHAIADPRTGLFDARAAAAWVVALGQRTTRPYLLALPAYGARVATGAHGQLLAVSAEMNAMDGAPGAEIAADPREVASLLEALRRDPPPGLRGMVWFRLPTENDQRVWSAATLRAVVRGAAHLPHIAVALRPGRISGVADVLVTNDGDVDGALPARVALPPSCAAADGVGEYAIDGDGLALRGHGMLRAHAAVLAGWARCMKDKDVLF